MSNLTISRKAKLFLLAMPALLALLYFALEGASQKYRAMQAEQELKALVGLAAHANALIHEVQRERDMSSGFLASQGGAFSNTLARQREATDQAARTWQEAAAALANRAELQHALRPAVEEVQALGSRRQEVDSLSLAPWESFAGYTNFIGILFRVVALVAQDNEHGPTVKQAAAYLAFLQGKEQAGQERAALNNAFTADRFDSATYSRLLASLAAQEAYFGLFLAYASDDAVALYRQKMRGVEPEAVDRMRRQALDRAQEGRFEVDPAYWFRSMTRKIDAMKDVEDRLCEELGAMASRQEDRARAALSLYAAAAVLGMAIAMLLAGWGILHLARQRRGEPGQKPGGASAGGDGAQATVAAMKAIAARIAVVDDIAGQANLLALNAAIEAARADQNGKGFAAVAAAVRRLAEKSQAAAREIGALAEASLRSAEVAGQRLDGKGPSILNASPTGPGNRRRLRRTGEWDLA